MSEIEKMCIRDSFDDTFLADGAEGNGFELQVISEHAFTCLLYTSPSFRCKVSMPGPYLSFAAKLLLRGTWW